MEETSKLKDTVQSSDFRTKMQEKGASGWSNFSSWAATATSQVSSFVQDLTTEENGLGITNGLKPASQKKMQGMSSKEMFIGGKGKGSLSNRDYIGGNNPRRGGGASGPTPPRERLAPSTSTSTKIKPASEKKQKSPKRKKMEPKKKAIENDDWGFDLDDDDTQETSASKASPKQQKTKKEYLEKKKSEVPKKKKVPN
eukprot:TRINITY_DN4591_c0_g1_i1.p1 TRINITY_DN4591_c0_g1~~TRINITY_DN4591_c0_g1_i1.p1  ORF type:complete len:198 (-),score=55.32 TRINITY_DN4591_c0_g1_i1:46-639(-)